MNRFKINLRNLTLLIVGLSLLPRIFSSFLYSPSTIIIIIFWITPLVLLPEFIDGFGSKKFQIQKIPRTTYCLLIFCFLTICTSFYWRNDLYTETHNSLTNLRRSLFLLHPIILFSLYPLVQSKNKKNFIKVFSILSLGFAFALGTPLIIYSSSIGAFLNSFTANISAFLSSFFLDSKINVIENRFFSESFAIDVLGGCSATPNMLIALFSMLVFYLCCPIKNLKYLVIIGIISPLIAFTINSIRISILAYFVAIDETEKFDFWHGGLGSLLFVFISMFISCFIYYYFWNKENPIET